VFFFIELINFKKKITNKLDTYISYTSRPKEFGLELIWWYHLWTRSRGTTDIRVQLFVWPLICLKHEHTIIVKLFRHSVVQKNNSKILTCTLIHLRVMNPQAAEYGKSFKRRHVTVGKWKASFLNTKLNHEYCYTVVK